jgi:hypothetical protein
MIAAKRRFFEKKRAKNFYTWGLGAVSALWAECGDCFAARGEFGAERG